MNILLELNNKIVELKSIGINDSQIKEESLRFLKDILKESSFQDRKDFWLHIDRNKKLDELLSGK